MQAVTAQPAPLTAITLTERQQYRLDTANLIFKSLAAAGLHTFGRKERLARLEPKRLGGFYLLMPTADARPVDLSTSVRGQARLLPGFSGTYAEQRLVRSLATYVIEGRSVPAAMLAQALMAESNQYFDRVESNFNQVIAKFRFSRAFTKPTEINRKTGEMA
ncbi:hypothetical protein [Pseudomonas sp. MPR-ANC1]|uniref:hypothetical protein n=1 Tax=Pseudomonas sp. MPR-ANC1 TaxID=2075548 RepID=UPI0011AFC14D|nr:hypothetical protein [Pseudomonas sp. MPR-ANC1]